MVGRDVDDEEEEDEDVVAVVVVVAVGVVMVWLALARVGGEVDVGVGHPVVGGKHGDWGGGPGCAELLAVEAGRPGVEEEEEGEGVEAQALQVQLLGGA
jgi:hypothetical protein